MLPSITVVVATCNRPLDAARCVDSLTRVTYPKWSLMVIDQSDDDETRRAVARLDKHVPMVVQYVHVTQKGLTRARNAALRWSRSEILAFIDDDCTVEPGWLSDVAGAFDRWPDVPLIFGKVLPVPHDPKQCFVPSHGIAEDLVLHGRMMFRRAGSIMGASMYLRRAVGRDVGPFDVYAGPGARFNIEDRDYAYRCLAAGYTVLRTPAVTVLHHGTRRYDDRATRSLLRSYGFGFGAQDMKFLRCGDKLALLVIAGHLVKMLGFVRWGRLATGRVRGSHALWILMYVRGLMVGLRPPVMRSYGLWGNPEEYELADLVPIEESTTMEGVVDTQSIAAHPMTAVQS
jgi:glycosyltransferase involved in cell wall biosynthesis